MTPTLYEIIAEQTSCILDAQRIAANLRTENQKLREALEELVSEFGICGLTENARAALGETK